MSASLIWHTLFRSRYEYIPKEEEKLRVTERGLVSRRLLPVFKWLSSGFHL